MTKLRKEHVNKAIQKQATTYNPSNTSYGGSRGVGAFPKNKARQQFARRQSQKNNTSAMAAMLRLAQMGGQRGHTFKYEGLNYLRDFMNTKPGSKKYRQLAQNPKIRKALTNPKQFIREAYEKDPSVKTMMTNDKLKKQIAMEAGNDQRVREAVGWGFSNWLNNADDAETIGGMPADWYRAAFKPRTHKFVNDMKRQGVARGVNKNVDYTSPWNKFTSGDIGMMELGGKLFKNFLGAGDSSNVV